MQPQTHYFRRAPIGLTALPLLGVLALPGLSACSGPLEHVEPEPVPADGARLACAAEIDEGDDGFSDAREQYRYDAAGRLVERVHDNPNWSTTTVFAYGATGRLVSETARTPKFDGYTQYDFTYDDADRRILTTHRYGENGTPQWYLHAVYDGDARHPNRHEGATTSDGDAVWTWLFEYDDAGNQIRETFLMDEEPLDDFPYVLDTAYNAQNHRVSESYVSESSVNDYKNAFVYDASGRLVKTTYDRGPDGEVDRIDTWTYAEDGALIEKRVGDEVWSFVFLCDDD